MKKFYIFKPHYHPVPHPIPHPTPHPTPPLALRLALPQGKSAVYKYQAPEDTINTSDVVLKAQSTRIYFQRFEIHPIQISLSFIQVAVGVGSIPLRLPIKSY